MYHDYKHDIHVDKKQKSYGYLTGHIDGLNWYALLHKEEVPYGVNPITLKRGLGRVTRLYLYEEKSTFEGNPFAPSMSLKRTIHAEFEDGWKILNPAYMSYIEELILFVERRYSFKIIK